MTTNWTQAEIDDLMAERDAAIVQLKSARLTVSLLTDHHGAAIRERDAAHAILQAFVDAEETALTSSRKSLGEYVDAMDRARKLLGQS